MRQAMAPSRGSTKSALDLMKESVTAFRTPDPNTKAHFFEVKLEGFTDEPDECTSARTMYDFVSQVAPVPYPEEFPYRAKLREAATKSNIPIEEVRITIKNGKGQPKPVTKRYTAAYEFDSGTIGLSDCAIYQSKKDSKKEYQWWAWVGKKSESGAYTDARVSGLRVRVRNIQIDGTEIIRDVFRDHAKSYLRFQDYFVGEIFIRPSALVPNARRDGFEEDANWKRIRSEFATVVKELGKEAYQVSKQGQLSVDALRENLENAKKDLKALRRTNFSNTDRVITLSKKVTTSQARVAKAVLGASMETAAELQAIGSKLADIKQEALSHVGNAAAALDREKIQLETRDELLQEILVLLEDNLSPHCFAEAYEALAQEYDLE